ncbi:MULTISPECIES: hypothetical protein [unclassified Bradyrhizobium]|uniref:hypothetical protein n=1 Tax=unclassified Bradyrhizobium TaxID=2631580 RepID=UPI00247977D9|nr:MULTISPECIES: hypothetical protein [unclassified Bradyrhizobium]WGS19551.1 hypothetical protein MTX22_35130 [Bradyrhizobium sp. ISRA463]WGS26389.1 hypothetical protein MTX19_32605 [Bradyrhizobium sp. ISRA464]
MSSYLDLQTRNMEPKEITRILSAYERALHTLCVRDGDDPLTEIIAKTIIKVAETGIEDPAEISARAISELEMR